MGNGATTAQPPTAPDCREGQQQGTSHQQQTRPPGTPARGGRFARGPGGRTGVRCLPGTRRSRPWPEPQFTGGLQCLQLRADVELQHRGDPSSLGDHEHPLWQPLQVPRLKGLQLLDTEAQPFGQGVGGQTPGLAGLTQTPPQGRQAGALLSCRVASASASWTLPWGGGEWHRGGNP